jgi:hypothetical protein
VGGQNRTLADMSGHSDISGADKSGHSRVNKV